MVTCRKCGKKYPADAGYFYQRSNGQYLRPCKACIRAKSEARYDAKKDEINARLAERMATDSAYRAKKLASDAASYQRNRESRLLKQAEYRQRSEVKERRHAYFHSLRKPDFVAAKKRYLQQYHAARRADHATVEKLRAQGRQWAKDNPEKAKAATRNRRARLRAAPGFHTAEDVQEQLAKQGGRCFWCDCEMEGKHTVDHYIPLARGGSNGPENIVLACATCNYTKQAKLPDEFIRYRQEVQRST